jgi:hypothetical protein
MQNVYQATRIEGGEIIVLKADNMRAVIDHLVEATFSVKRCSAQDLVTLIGDPKGVIVVPSTQKKKSALDDKTLPLPFPDRATDPESIAA